MIIKRSVIIFFQIRYDWIEEYDLVERNVDVTAVDPELVMTIPRVTHTGKVYQRLIYDIMQPGETGAEGIIRVFNDDICNVIDNYNYSAYYDLYYVIARAYQNGRF